MCFDPTPIILPSPEETTLTDRLSVLLTDIKQCDSSASWQSGSQSQSLLVRRAVNHWRHERFNTSDNQEAETAYENTPTPAVRYYYCIAATEINRVQ